MKPRPKDILPATIFIPVYNEEDIIFANIERLVSYLGRYFPLHEIMIVSNGSTDSTIKIGEKLQDSYPEVTFFHISEKGVGRAFKKGVALAAWDRIITVDVDLTTDLDFIPRAGRLLDDYDIVIGSKKTGYQKRSAVRLLGSGLFILFVRMLLGLPYVDYSIGAKAYRKEAILRYLNLVNYGSCYVIEIIYRAWCNGAKIIEIPVWCEDTRGSKFNLLHEGVYRFFNLFKLWFGKKRKLLAKKT